MTIPRHASAETGRTHKALMARNANGALPPAEVVDVWLLSIAALTDDVRAFHERQLSEEELARARRYLVAHARDEFVAARALLRTQLSRYTGAPIKSWQFESNRFGRPSIASPMDHRHIRFNVSHTNGLVACAVSAEHEIGVDLENVTRRLDVLSLAQAFFAPPEREALARLPLEEGRSRFFSYWTLKESYIKARGMGLSVPLDAFWFELGHPPRLHCEERCQDSPDRWQFVLEQPTREHRLALAVASPPPSSIDVRLFWMTHDLVPVRPSFGVGCRVLDTP